MPDTIARARLGGLTIWRIQCTTCKTVFTVLPHFVLRYCKMRPDVARDALLATHGGLSLELCAVICHVSPMALYRLVVLWPPGAGNGADAVWVTPHSIGFCGKPMGSQIARAAQTSRFPESTRCLDDVFSRWVENKSFNINNLRFYH